MIIHMSILLTKNMLSPFQLLIDRKVPTNVKKEGKKHFLLLLLRLVCVLATAKPPQYARNVRMFGCG
jgi:hypothetical protein